MPFTADGQPIDLIFNPLGVPARMNLGQLFEAHLGIAADKLGMRVKTPVLNGLPKEKVVELLKKADLPEDGKQQLYDGRSGEPLSERTTIGYMYIYKLNHMVSDKVHVRSTGPYAMVTQQPLVGKSHNGGQRFGEMEVWALESYGAAHTLQEMLTLKSDDMTGRAKAYESIIKQVDIVSPKIPESFNILVKELQGLGLKIDLVDQENQLVNAEEVLEASLHQKGQEQPIVMPEETLEVAEVTASQPTEGDDSDDTETETDDSGGDLDEIIGEDLNFSQEFETTETDKETAEEKERG